MLSNAVKFSNEKGKIKVAIGERNDSFMVSIKDEGIGVPEEELESVFDKFVQSSKTKTGAGGTGLGLSICKEILAVHHGRIWAENNPSGGAIFAFEIPLKRVMSAHERTELNVYSTS